MGNLIKSTTLTDTDNGKKFEGKVSNRMLLIDESDVFFIGDFYGETYIPIIELRADSIKQLLLFIYNNRNQTSLKGKVSKSA